MMQPECRISWRGEDISAGVTTDGEMAAGMNAVDTVAEIALHDGLEPVDVGVAGDEAGRVGVGCPA